MELMQKEEINLPTLNFSSRKKTFSFFGKQKEALAELASELSLCLDQYEKIPVKFNPQLPKEVCQSTNFRSYLEAGHVILQKLSSTNICEVTLQVNHLKRRLVALEYRLGKVNGGYDKTCLQTDLLAQLKNLASQWKHDQPIFYDKSIGEKEFMRLRQSCHYPNFISLLFSDPILFESFMQWVVRDKNDPTPFIEFPALHQRIVDCGLNGRIGRMGGEFLRVVLQKTSEDCEEKIVTLPFEGKSINILNDETIIVFRGNYKLSIREVFEIFKNKKFTFGNLEFMAEGIINWNVQQFGFWDCEKQDYQRINLNQKEWWNQLPIFEVLSKEIAQHKYGWHLDGKTWNIAATASRGSPTLDFDQTHAYLEVAIPLKSGHYAIYDFGKFAKQFPATFFESLATFCQTVPATVAYPDENVFYTHRQHTFHSFCMTPKEGQRLMRSIKEDIKSSYATNFVFQIESENCAKWSQTKLEKILGKKRIPNLFKMRLLDTEPIGLVAAIFNLIKKMPRMLQTRLLTFLHLPFGARNGTWIVEEGKKVWKSLNTHPFWETAEVYLPAFLHKQKESGNLANTFNSRRFYA